MENPHKRLVYADFRWRSGWDSNPRAREDYLISSQARYDHFDTAPYMLNRRFSPPFSGEKRALERIDGKNSKLIQFSNRVKPAWLQGFWWTKRTASRKISSQARYDHFDTLPSSIIKHPSTRRTLTF